MKRSVKLRLTLFIIVIVISLASVGCRSKEKVQLCDGFVSRESVGDSRRTIESAGKDRQWQEESKGTSKDDKRPPYKFVILSGPFTLKGTDGKLKLTFYNNQLMSTEFTTRKGQEYLAALSREKREVPNGPRQEIEIAPNTRLLYEVDPGGVFRFICYDRDLLEEWEQWIAENA